MIYENIYKSPIGDIYITSDGKNITGAWLAGQKYFKRNLKEPTTLNSTCQIFKDTEEWFKSYFRGENPDLSNLSLEPSGSEFQKTVWNILRHIPYGETASYGQITKKVSDILNKPSMSAQAVGQAIAHNPILIIIPCHRVIGKNGNLTGYAGGQYLKLKLLKFEGVSLSKLKN